MDLAIIALSARPLAASAARAGFAALSLDLFADLDTCTHSARCVRVHKKNGCSFDGDDLIAALTTLSPEGLPVVLGAGLDDDLALMARIAERNPILGNSPQTLRVLKDPLAMSALCAHLEIPFPMATLQAGADFGGSPVLEKKIGGAGGAHIRRHPPGHAAAPAPGHFLQREVPGTPYSLLLLAGGGRSCVVGAARQWRSGDAIHPFRYGGSVGPVTLPEPFAADILADIERLVRSSGLVGLVSADVMVDDAGWHLVEVNPRPSQLLDIFDVDPLPPLMGLHIAACGGRLPQGLPSPSEIHASATLYADRDLIIPTAPWPEQVADRPAAGAAITAGSSVCTVHATAPNEEMALERVEKARALVCAGLGMAEAPVA